MYKYIFLFVYIATFKSYYAVKSDNFGCNYKNQTNQNYDPVHLQLSIFLPNQTEKIIMPSVEHLKKDTFVAMFKCLKNVKVKIRYVASILSLFYYHNFATDMFS